MSEEQFNKDETSNKESSKSLLNFLFDEEYYIKNNPDLKDIDMSYLDHYMSFGWKEGRDPSSRFSTAIYIENNQDVKDAGFCPLWHFIHFGFNENRDIYPVEEVEVEEEQPLSLANLVEIINEGKLAEYIFDNRLARFLFDADFYIENNPDIQVSGIDPFFHYFNYGWKEGRDPSANICVRSYQAQLGTDLEVEPISHFIFFGKTGKQNLFKGKISSGASDVYDSLMSVHRADVRKADYSPFFDTSVIKNSKVRTLAMYLPQFHPFEQNDLWWGKGFTEWRNVAKTIPQFQGHYQPRLPGELGYYDLRLKDTFEAQINLAQSHGIDGFCFHYYWFGGTKLMEKPLELFLKNKDLNIQFCLCWANENWTRRWDGSENDVLIAQQHSVEDHKAIFKDLLRYFVDERYIRVGNKPVVVVYRPSIIPDVASMLEIWRSMAKEEGLDGLYIISTNSFGFKDYETFGFDGLVEFPPHDVQAGIINESLDYYNDQFSGFVYEYGDVSKYCKNRLENIAEKGKGKNYYPTVMTAWDNSARKPGKGNVFHNASPLAFHDWFDFAYKWSLNNHEDDASFVFINAWNEWAEGTYLEPDLAYGYSYLNAVRTTINEVHEGNEIFSVINSEKQHAENAIFLHIFYEDMVDELSSLVNSMREDASFDVIVTVPNGCSSNFAEEINTKIKPNVLLKVRNRGRDIFPFFCSMDYCSDRKYKRVLKLHSKKSRHLKDGDVWRQSIYSSLCSKTSVEYVMSKDFQKERLGIICPSESIKELKPDSLVNNQELMVNILEYLEVSCPDLTNQRFVAGTMFWFNFEVLKNLVKNLDYATLFGPELGAIDGTYAHAFERLFVILTESSGFETCLYEVDSYYYPY